MCVTSPNITYDHPLWLKVFEIASSKNLDTDIHLEGFYTLMSFIGGIETIMKRPELERPLEPVYVKNLICHIMSGKAASRAIPALLQVESALTTLLLETMQEELEISVFERIYHDLLNGKITPEEVNESVAITSQQELLQGASFTSIKDCKAVITVS